MLHTLAVGMSVRTDIRTGKETNVFEAAGACQPVFTYARRNPQAHNYLALAKLVTERLALSR